MTRRRALTGLADKWQQSIKQTVNHASMLSKKPSESAAKDLADHTASAASVKMWAPLWPQPHRPNENAVFGLALNYDIRHYHWFVGSLRKVGFGGDIVLGTNTNLQPQLEKFLKESQVIAYPLYVRCKSKLQCAIEQWFQPIDGTLPMAIIRHYLYLNWLQHYSPSSLLCVLDFRDTVFQSDPFLLLEKERRAGSTTQLWLAGEHMPYKRIRNCVFNSGWIRDCYGEADKIKYGAYPVICSGSIFGTKKGLEGFETLLLQEVSKKKCHEHYVESDQGYTNVLFHSGALEAAGVEAQLDPRGQGPVNTVGAFGGKRHGYYVGGEIIKALRDDEGYVLNCPLRQPVPSAFTSCSDAARPGSPCLKDKDAHLNFADCKDVSRSPVVHQWDRHAGDLGGFINKKLSCTTKCANSSALAAGDPPFHPAGHPYNDGAAIGGGVTFRGAA
eukprot:CAMPEP_0172643906 /NCGR_PEP_ID=MMETSP1068-20121228/238869_1 /TAXON_ID=35684 /ORGANISM="Pseudopedinella elastica, Strain CCMP716" /LENGTH=442 /DNA_ID=CAMNT_0013458071 /DNA_START=153 /DNA_END=1482 /DNA_ORIENTATION=-